MSTFCLIFLVAFVALFALLAWKYIDKRRKKAFNKYKTRKAKTSDIDKADKALDVFENFKITSDKSIDNFEKTKTTSTNVSASSFARSYSGSSRSGSSGSTANNDNHLMAGITLGHSVGSHSHQSSRSDDDSRCSGYSTPSYSSGGSDSGSSSSDSSSGCSGGSYD